MGRGAQTTAVAAPPRPRRRAQRPDEHHAIWRLLDGYRCPRTGLRIQADPARPQPDASVTIEGVILDAAHERVGAIRRRLLRDRAGNLVLRNEHLHLQDTWHGHGFARELLAAIETQARASDVQRIEVHTMDAGSFTWARCGYEFNCGLPDASPQLRRIAGAGAAANLLLLGRGRLDRLARRGLIDASDAEEFAARFATPAEISDGALAGKFVSPVQIAAFGERGAWLSDGRPTWLGREFLIGSAWSGVRELRPAGR